MAALQKPIVLSTLATILGTRKDVGAVCTSDNINMWAKNKSVQSGFIGELTDEQRKAAQYGLSVSGVQGTSPAGLLSVYDGEKNGWQHAKPRGYAGYGEWYRMLDFVGYDAEASHPLGNYEAPTSMVYDSSPTVPFSMGTFIGPTFGFTYKGIDLGDIRDILNGTYLGLYFGVALFQGAGLTPQTAANARCEIATNPNPMEKPSGLVVQYTNTYVNFLKRGLTDADKGLWTIVPFFCVGAISQCGSWSGTTRPTRTFYPVPYASVTTIDIQGSMDGYTITFEGLKTASSLEATIKIKNNGTSSRTLTLSCYYWDRSIPGTPETRSIQTHERQYTNTLTVGAGLTYNWRVPSSDVPSQLIPNAVAYISVQGESKIRGPIEFRSIIPDE